MQKSAAGKFHFALSESGHVGHRLLDMIIQGNGVATAAVAAAPVLKGEKPADLPM
jgi:hypothetical protein